MDIRFPPDIFIRDRIVQPIVDTFHIDPQIAKWSCFRFMTIGLAMSLTSALLVMMVQQGPHQQYMMMVAGIYLIGYTFMVAQVGLQIGDLPYRAMRGFDVSVRMIWLVYCAIMLTGCVRELVLANGTMIRRIVMLSITASWHAGVASAYLNICRRPPPPRDDGAKRIAFAGQ